MANIKFQTTSPYDQQMESLARRQKIADMLQQQSMDPLESQTAPGGMVVPTSPVLGLIQMLKGGLAGYQQGKIGKERTAAEAADRQSGMDFLKNMTQGQQTQVSPDQAMEASMSSSPTDFPARQPMLSGQERTSALIGGAMGGSPRTQQIAQMLMAQKQPNISDYVNKVDVKDIDPASLGQLQEDLRAGRQPDMTSIRLKPPEAKAPVLHDGQQFNSTTQQWEPAPGFKQPTQNPTEISRMIAEHDALPPGDPSRRILEDAIRKATRIVEPPAFSPEAVSSLAARYVAGDKTALFGLGRSQAAMSAVQNEIAKQMQGQKPDEIVRRQREMGIQTGTENEFTRGKSATTIQSLNTFTQHSNHLYQLADALDRGDLSAINKAKIAWQNATGTAAPNDMALVGQLVADELQKAALGATGGQEERTALVSRLSGAKSGKVIKSAIEQARYLVKGQLGSLQQKWKAGYGDPVEFNDRFLTEDSRALFAPKTNATTTAAPPGMSAAHWEQVKDVWDHLTPEEKKAWLR